MLAEFARQRHGVEAALDQPAMQPAHAFPRRAEHQAGPRFEVAQHVDRRALRVVRRHGDGAVLDVAMRLVASAHVDAQRVPLVAPGEGGDLLRDGGGEQQRAPLARRRVQDELQVLAEAEVQHLVRLVQHGHAQAAEVEPPALQMVAQPPRRADDDVAPGCQRPLLRPAVHAADAGRDARAGLLVKPGQLPPHLHRQFPRGRDGEGERRRGPVEPLGLPQQRGREGEAVGDGLARAGLRGHQKVAPLRLLRQDGGLHGGGFEVVAFGERAVESRIDGRKGHAFTSCRGRTAAETRGLAANRRKC